LNETENKILILSELKECYQAKLEAGEALDEKLHNLIAASGLVLAVFSTFGMIESGPVWYWVVIIAFGLLYLGSLVGLGREAVPKEYAFPVKAEWDELYTAYVPLDKPDLYDRLIYQYTLSIADVGKVIERKARAVRIGYWALPSLLILLSVARLVLVLAG
jgi:hypothetical protein